MCINNYYKELTLASKSEAVIRKTIKINNTDSKDIDLENNDLYDTLNVLI